MTSDAAAGTPPEPGTTSTAGGAAALPGTTRVVTAGAAGAVPLTVATPPGAPRAAVLVIQEAFGVTDHIADVARRAAAAGYLAVAPHLFHRTGDPQLPYTDIPAVYPHMQALAVDGIEHDLDAAFGWLAGQGVAAGQVGMVGFCMGGSVTLAAAVRRPFGAAVCFYGGGLASGRFGYPPLLEIAAGLQTPFLGLFGADDTGIPVAEVDQLRAAVGGAAVPADVVVYPAAGHGFHCDARDSYVPAAATDAWARALAFLAVHTGPAGLAGTPAAGGDAR